MPGNDGVVAITKNRDIEPEIPNALGNGFDGGIVFAGILIPRLQFPRCDTDDFHDVLLVLSVLTERGRIVAHPIFDSSHFLATPHSGGNLPLPTLTNDVGFEVIGQFAVGEIRVDVERPADADRARAVSDFQVADAMHVDHVGRVLLRRAELAVRDGPDENEIGDSLHLPSRFDIALDENLAAFLAKLDDMGVNWRTEDGRLLYRQLFAQEFAKSPQVIRGGEVVGTIEQTVKDRNADYTYQELNSKSGAVTPIAKDAYCLHFFS